MNLIIRKPHLFFWGIIPIFIIISFLKGESAFDLNIYDTYAVLPISNLCYLSVFFFGLIGINYYVLFWAKKPPKKQLTSIHFILQTLSLVFFIYLMFTVSSSENLVETPYNSSINENTLFIVSFVLFLLATIIHFINFFISLFVKRE